MSYLRYLCLFGHSGVQHIVLCFCLVFLHFVYLMLPVSLDCPFLIAPSVFSNIYLYILGIHICFEFNKVALDLPV